MKKNIYLSINIIPNIYFFLFFFILIYLKYYFSNIPLVMADELVHSRNAFFQNEFKVSSFLFYDIYGLKIFKNHFDTVKNILNIFFFVFALLIMKNSISINSNNIIKLYILLIITFLGIDIYCFFYMPEVFFLFIFSLLIYYLIKINWKRNLLKNTFIISIIITFLSLVKPHALIILPSIMIFLFYLTFQQKNNFKILFLLIFFVFILKFAYERIILIDTDLFIGEYYRKEIVRAFFASFSTNFLKHSIIHLMGTLGAFVIICGIPLIVITNFVIENTSRIKKYPLLIITFLILFNLIIFYSFYHSGTHGHLENDAYMRINTRYLFFILPFVYLAAIEIFYKEKYKCKNFKVLIFVYFIYSTLILFYYYFFTPTQHIVDGPLLRGITYNLYFFILYIFFLLIFLFHSVSKNFKNKITNFFSLILLIFLIVAHIPIRKELINHNKNKINYKVIHNLKKNINPDDIVIICSLEEYSKILSLSYFLNYKNLYIVEDLNLDKDLNLNLLKFLNKKKLDFLNIRYLLILDKKNKLSVYDNVKVNRYKNQYLIKLLKFE